MYQRKRLGQITLTYKATLERADSSSAEYHFNHRGSMSIGNSKKVEGDAKKRAFDQLNKASEDFKKEFGSYQRIIFNNPITIELKRNELKYISLTENFFAENKKNSIIVCVYKKPA